MEDEMNQYQKLAALLIRLIGTAIAVVGMMGPLYIGILVALGKHFPTYSLERWMGSVVWAVSGILMIIFSKNLGRLFGRGLS